MSHEKSPSNEIQKEGVKWLDMLGHGHLSGTESPYSHPDTGTPLLWDDFTDICGDHVRPVMTALEAMSPTDPRRIQAIELLVLRYIAPHLHENLNNG